MVAETAALPGAETAIRAVTCAIGDAMSHAQSTTEEAALIEG